MLNVDFNKVLKDAGLPTTEAELISQWQQELESQGSPITNDSKWSPFRRLIDAIMVAPAKQVIDALINVNLPNQFVATATGDMLLLKGDDLQLTLLPATYAKGQVLFSRADTSQQLTIDAGTFIRTPTINGKVYRVVTTAQVTLGIGVASILASVEAENPGAVYNLPEGYYNIIDGQLEGVTVTNQADWLTDPGTDQETEDDFRLRCRNQFNLVGEYHTDAVYRGMLAEQFGIRTDDIYFQHDAPRGPGTANCFILLPVGNPSAQFLADINAFITDMGNHGHGDDLQVFAMPETQHDLTVDLYCVSGLTAAAKTALAEQVDIFIRAAFRENQLYSPTITQPLETFSFSRLSQELHDQFPNIKRLVFGNTDIANGLNIARINTLGVTTYG